MLILDLQYFRWDRFEKPIVLSSVFYDMQM